MLGALRLPAFATTIVAAGALASTSPLVDPEKLSVASGANLVYPIGYRVAAPIFAILDQLSLLTMRQHVALLLTVFGLLAVYRALAKRGRGYGRQRFMGDLRAFGWVFGVVLAVYGSGLIAPRSMARLTLADREDVAVDFHSHTNESHDVRSTFSLGANREWHLGAGFDVVYVTDHGAAAAERSAASIAPINPARAGDAIVMLPGLEVVDGGTHVVALAGAFAQEERDARTLDNVRDPARKVAQGRLTPQIVEVSDVQHAPEPSRAVRQSVVIQTIPAALSHIETAGLERIGSALSAIELLDAAPRGLDQSARDRETVLGLADRYDLAVVAASNNHGFGRTAVAWSVLHLPGWRNDSPARLAQRIEQKVLTDRRRAVRVVARRGVSLAAPTALSLALTAPDVMWDAVTTLDWGNRVSCLFWIWLIPLTRMVMASRRRLRPVRPRGAARPPSPPAGDAPATEAA